MDKLKITTTGFMCIFLWGIYLQRSISSNITRSKKEMLPKILQIERLKSTLKNGVQYRKSILQALKEEKGKLERKNLKWLKLDY